MKKSLIPFLSRKTIALSFSFVIAANCGASTELPSPDEVLVWDLAEYETGTGAQWQTVSFPTLPGAVYTLTSSHDLENWEALQSFYAVGTELELALFELAPSPTTGTTGDSGEIPEETTPITNVNFRLRPLTGDNGTLVTWTPLEEGSPEAKHTQILTLNLAPEWESLPFYINDFDPFLFMLGAHLGSPVDPATVVPTQLPIASPDAEVFQRLQAEIAGIQQTVITNHATWENAPVPPPPHPDAKCFYRLERTLPDSDGDGLPDYLEIHAGLTDPFNSDTDGDGTPDGQDPDSFPPGGSPGAVPPGTSFSYTITKEESRTSISGMGNAGLGYVSYPVDATEYTSDVLEPAIVFDSYEQAAAANIHFDQSGAEDGWREETGNGRINLGQNTEGWYGAFHTEKRVTINPAPVQSPVVIHRQYLHLREVPYEPDTIDVIGTVEEELLIPIGETTSDPGEIVEATSPSFHSGKGFFTESMSEGHDEFLLPVEIAPEVLAVNSDFDEGRIDPATGYAIPDCDDMTDVNRKKGSGNTLVSLSAARDHLDDENITTGKPVTDDLHQGWFGVNPNQLGDDFWDGADVTIKKVNQVDPDTGRQESGQIRFYAKWGDGADESIGITPYDFQSLQATNLVAGGVHGGGSVYGSASSLPDDTEFWMEGVRPGKITLEWRLQKGGIDVKHEQTFDIVTEQSVADWRNEIRYQIQLQTSVAGNEVNIEQFNPNAEFLANDPFIQAIYAWYEQTFKESDDDMKWAGMAKMAGAPVYAALKDAQLGRVLAPGVGAGATARSMQTALMVGNRDIFMDLAWQHRAYAASGIFALKFVDEQDDGGNEIPIVPLEQWQEIDEGIATNSHFKASRGASFLLRREQQFIVDSVYVAIIQLGLAEIISILAENPIPNRNFAAQLGKSFQEVVPGGNLAEFDERWNWIEQDMYPNWTNISAFALSLNVDLGSDIGGYSKQTRCDEATIPLVQRAQTYTQNPF